MRLREMFKGEKNSQYMKTVDAGEFREEDHPRQPDGKFGSGGGGSKASSSEPSKKDHSGFFKKMHLESTKEYGETAKKHAEASSKAETPKDALIKANWSMQSAEQAMESANSSGEESAIKEASEVKKIAEKAFAMAKKRDPESTAAFEAEEKGYAESQQKLKKEMTGAAKKDEAKTRKVESAVKTANTFEEKKAALEAAIKHYKTEVKGWEAEGHEDNADEARKKLREHTKTLEKATGRYTPSKGRSSSR